MLMDEINAKEFEVFDGKDKILGRLASTVAKRLLTGKKVAIINAEMAIISGDRKGIKRKYKVRLDLQEKENPEHSPYWPRRPDMLVKRVVRGMLPYKKRTAGKAAYRNLRVFIGVPPAFKDVKPIEIETKNPKQLYVGHVKVGELAQLLGYTK